MSLFVCAFVCLTVCLPACLVGVCGCLFVSYLVTSFDRLFVRFLVVRLC